MDLRRTRTFVTVAELGTVSKAAIHLRTAQPALSRQISELEHETGLKLFDRVGRRLVLTGEGEQLLADCRGLLELCSCPRGACTASPPRRHRGAQGGSFTANDRKRVCEIPAEYAIIIRMFRSSWRMPWAGPIHGDAGAWGVHLGQNWPVLQAVDRRFGAIGWRRLTYWPPVTVRCHSARPATSTSAASTIIPCCCWTQLHLSPNFDAACRLAGFHPISTSKAVGPIRSCDGRSGHGVAIIPSALQTDRYALRISAVTYRGKP